MESEVLRDLLIRFLREHAESQRRAGGVRDTLQLTRCVQGITGLIQNTCPEKLEGRTYLSEDDHRRLIQVIWDLILERVLIPSHAIPNSTNDGWPFLSLTEHGKQVVAEQSPIPYDPDGFIKSLDERVGGLHPTVKMYLGEAISTLRTGNHLSCAVMMGAASEWTFIELCEAVAEAHANLTEKAQFEMSVKSGKMFDYLAAFHAWLNRKRTQLPPEWQKPSYWTVVGQIADLIRVARNEAGHPQENPSPQSHEDLYAKLRLFAHQCMRMYELKTWLDTQTGKIT